MTYKLTTQKTWTQTQRELENEFRLWGIKNWDCTYPRGARSDAWHQATEDRTVSLSYQREGKTIQLSMGQQERAVDNLRVLYLAINAMRLNEARGIDKVLESAYKQLAGPVVEQSPWEILGIYPGSPLPIAEAAYKVKALECHPDRGGSLEKMQSVNKAIQNIREGKV